MGQWMEEVWESTPVDPAGTQGRVLESPNNNRSVLSSSLILSAIVRLSLLALLS